MTGCPWCVPMSSPARRRPGEAITSARHFTVRNANPRATQPWHESTASQHLRLCSSAKLYGASEGARRGEKGREGANRLLAFEQESTSALSFQPHSAPRPRMTFVSAERRLHLDQVR